MYKRSSNYYDVIDMVLERIATLRETRGWDVRTLAKKAQINYSVVLSWYSGYGSPSLRSLLKMCNCLGISLSELFDQDDDILLTEEQEKLIHIASKLSRGEVEELVQYLSSIYNR